MTGAGCGNRAPRIARERAVGGARHSPRPAKEAIHADRRPPDAEAAALLRSLAQKTGTSFAPPTTKAEASREIERLKKLAESPRHEREHERRAVSEGLATGTSAARVREDEVEGYGSTARWR